MCMIKEFSLPVITPEYCFVIRATGHKVEALGIKAFIYNCFHKVHLYKTISYIKSPFQKTPWSIGEQRVTNFDSFYISKLAVGSELTNEVFHTFETYSQAKEVKASMDLELWFIEEIIVNIFLAEGSGAKVSGKLIKFEDGFNGQPCVGYTKLTLLAKLEG